MLTLPVVCELNGIIFGSILIAIGGIITIFSGMCIVTCSEKTDSESLEFIAYVAFGEHVSKLTSYLMLMCLLGYSTSYIIIVKTLTPYIIYKFTEGQLPAFLGNESFTQLMIATVYTIFFMLPLSLPRKMGALRFTSLFGFICCLFLVCVIIGVFVFSRIVVPNPVQNIKEAEYFNVSFSGIFSAFPFIISSYMYQPMVPAIYKNLERRNYRRMKKVISIGSYGAVLMYILIAVAGYLTFVGRPDQLKILAKRQNILELDYRNNFYFEIALVALVFTVMTAGPLCMLPSKDTLEEIVYKDQIMTDSQNVMVTVLLTGFCYICAILIPGIGDVLTVLGLT